MKKVIFILILFASISGYTQPISNGSFENWSTITHYEDPFPYFTSNSQSYLTTNGGNVTRITPGFSGNFSARFTTIDAGYDTIPGIGIIGDPVAGGIQGGIPYPALPDSIIGYARYNCNILDTGVVFGILKSGGSPLASFQVPFVGSEPGFVRFSAPVFAAPLPVQPDTLIVFIISSSADNPIPGNFIELDSLTFISNSNPLPPFPNGSFENWQAFQSEEPDQWNTINFVCNPSNPSVTKSTDAFDGLYSIRIETVLNNFGDTLGLVTNGNFIPDFPSGGMAVYQNPALISGYYKYFPQGQDTGLIGARITRFDQISQSTVYIDSSLYQFTAASAWTPFSLLLNYSAFPPADTMNLTFASSNIEDDTNLVWLGSFLLLDSLNVQYLPLSFQDRQNTGFVASLLPGDLLHFTGFSCPSQITLFDASGKQLLNEFTTSVRQSGNLFSYTTPVNGLSSGYYFWQITDREGAISSGKIALTR